MAATKKATHYRVVGPVAVIRKDKNERYINRGGIIPATGIDEKHAQHLLSVKLIEPFEPEDAADDGEVTN